MIYAPTSTTMGSTSFIPTTNIALPSLSITTAGHDDDGEEILVEEDPLPHEVAVDPVLRCRYPSKHCLRARSVKKTGALHSMCAFHRAKANRNQRRLEKRKRLRAASGENQISPGWLELQSTSGAPMSPPFDLLPTENAKLLSKNPASCLQPVRDESNLRFHSPRQVSDDFEPFQTPAPLLLEDLKELCELVDVDVQGLSE